MAQTITSAASATASVTAAISDYWLKDPVGGTSSKVRVSDFQRLDHGLDYAEHLPLQDPADAVTHAVVLWGARRGVRGTVEFATTTQAERQAVLAVLEKRRPLLLQMPPDAPAEYGEQWYAAFAASSETRRSTGVSAARGVAADWVEVDSP